jgi:ribosome-binding protein aMBF1 (putative translation factor)
LRRRRTPILGRPPRSPLSGKQPSAVFRATSFRPDEAERHAQRYRRRAGREAAGLTQAQVAERLGLYASFVSKAESGERRLDVAELAALCDAYGAGLLELLREAGFIDG